VKFPGTGVHHSFSARGSIALNLTSLHLIAPHCTSLHLTAPHCTSLHLTAPHCTSLHLTPPGGGERGGGAAAAGEEDHRRQAWTRRTDIRLQHGGVQGRVRGLGARVPRCLGALFRPPKARELENSNPARQLGFYIKVWNIWNKERHFKPQLEILVSSRSFENAVIKTRGGFEER